jgi:hypothetical protein
MTLSSFNHDNNTVLMSKGLRKYIISKFNSDKTTELVCNPQKSNLMSLLWLMCSIYGLRHQKTHEVSQRIYLACFNVMFPKLC